MNVETTIRNLKSRGFTVTYFPTAAEAADYLDGAIDGKTVGVGGTVTVQDLGMYERLTKHNEVYWHWYESEGLTLDEVYARCATAQVYLSSVNAIAETGEIVNIDGKGNRTSSMLFGHEKLYLVAGVNKIAGTYEKAVWRARNIAAPKDAQRLGCKTPCAIKADKCYDCKSPDRICNGLLTLLGPMSSMETEIVLIGEALGF